MKYDYFTAKLLLVTLAFCLSTSVHAELGKSKDDPLDVCTLSTDRVKYDGKPWFVLGTITDLRNRKTSHGRRYQTAQLKDGNGGSCWVRLYNQTWLWDKTAQPQIAIGKTITLLGTYHRKVRVGKHTYEHEIHPGEVWAGNCHTYLTGNGWGWCPQ